MSDSNIDRIMPIVKQAAAACNFPLTDVQANYIACEYMGRDLIDMINNTETLRLHFENFFRAPIIE